MLSRKRFGSRCPPALCIYVLFFVFTSPPVWQSLCASDIPLPPLSPSYRHIAMKRNELHLLQAIFMANLAIYILETILREGMWLWSNKSDCYGEACGIYMYLCVILYIIQCYTVCEWWVYDVHACFIQLPARVRLWAFTYLQCQWMKIIVAWVGGVQPGWPKIRIATG